MSYLEVSADDRLRERDSRRSYVVRSIRGWLRAKRYPRLTVAMLLLACLPIATGFGWMLARWGVRGWGERAFWSVLAVWPVFILLMRWRAAAEFDDLPGNDAARHFVAMDDFAEQLAMISVMGDHEPEWKRSCRESIGREAGKAGPYTFLVLLFVGGLTLGTWLVWLLISHGATLLAETIVDAELIPARPQLIYSFQHLDWRAEAFGFTAVHFLGLAIAAAAVGCSAEYLPGFR